MANTLFDAARQRFLEGQFNWLTDTIKVILVDTGAYTPQTAIHQYLADIPLSARIAGPVTLTSKATTGGAADGADVTFTSVTGPSIEAIVIYVDTVADATAESSEPFNYVSTFNMRARVRNGNDVSAIVPFESVFSVTEAGGSVNSVRTADV